ncbi:hypothetical protein PPYR_13076 [Photinus pyralis]|uniref:Uncharacterized protein n=1 Tax=Photinus pyralis TaxID=7054 RepID=A0A5N4A7Z7_PHOPY|nr:uncharacterized protein LOC116179743 [Photinus pyralis]XP_031355422.1 uncharacterized protein LOC116179743 [Photinus pyralis]KAB0793456.1 hypothetical protein PPYR_13076 [Photinus pyralis]
MKIFIAVVACILAVTLAQDDELEKLVNDCAETAGLGDLEGYRKAAEENGINDEKVQKFSECVLRTRDEIKDDGTLDFSKYRAWCQVTGKDCSFVDECEKKKEDTTGKTYANVLLCGLKHSLKQ